MLSTRDRRARNLALAMGRAVQGTGVRSTKVSTSSPHLSGHVILWAFRHSSSLPSRVHSVKHTFFGQLQYPLASCEYQTVHSSLPPYFVHGWYLYAWNIFFAAHLQQHSISERNQRSEHLGLVGGGNMPVGERAPINDLQPGIALG